MQNSQKCGPPLKLNPMGVLILTLVHSRWTHWLHFKCPTCYWLSILCFCSTTLLLSVFSSVSSFGVSSLSCDLNSLVDLRRVVDFNFVQVFYLFKIWEWKLLNFFKYCLKLNKLNQNFDIMISVTWIYFFNLTVFTFSYNFPSLLILGMTYFYSYLMYIPDALICILHSKTSVFSVSLSHILQWHISIFPPKKHTTVFLLSMQTLLVYFMDNSVNNSLSLLWNPLQAWL